MRPFEHKSVLSNMDYKLAEKIVKRNDARTCSFCRCTSQEAFAFRNMKRQSVKEEMIQDIRVSNVDSHILAGVRISIANKTTMRI